MKNILRPLIQGICIISLLLSVYGCGEQYQRERLVWMAERSAEPVFLNDGKVSRFDFEKAVKMFEGVIAAMPETPAALNARFRIGQLFIARGESEKARDVYARIEADAAENKEVAATAAFASARTFEASGDWIEAEKRLRGIMETYPQTRQALRIPIYIARYYRKNNMPEKAELAYGQAVMKYQQLADTYPNTKGALFCENLVVRVLLEQEKWSQAVEFIQGLGEKYRLGPDTLLILGNIYSNKLQDQQAARKVFERVLTEYPEHPLVKKAREGLQSLSDS